MNFRWHTRALLALGSGAALALSFPNYNLWLLAWIALAMLVLASCGARPVLSPLYGFLHGIVFYPVCVPWIDVVMQEYGNVDPWSSAGILGLMAIAGGIVCSFFSLGVALASRRSKALACALAPFLWVTLEFARTHLPIIGFPWNLTGYAASGNLALVQLTPLTGIYGLTFLIATYGSLLGYAIMRGSQRMWKAALVVTAVLILIAAVGGYFVPKARPDHVARLVQTDFPQSEHYPGNWLQLHAGELDELERISVTRAEKGSASGGTAAPGLIVWPEVPAPFSLQDPAFAQRARRIAGEAHSYFLLGVIDWKLDVSRKYYATNSAVLLTPEGQRVFTYDKIHLVPFGEYVPLRNWIKFAGRLTADISDFTPGTEYRVGELPGIAGGVGASGSSAASAGAEDKFGTFICYEAIFPDEIRRFAKNGADLLINISNDGWFGRSSAPPQHLMMARVRAVENRRWLLRDTNNGYTVDVDPYGRIVARMPTDIRGELDAPYAFRDDLTLYTHFGNWFSWLCVFVSIALIGLSTRRIQKRA
jgi:apolipoprotein N-acyltransferase